MIIYGQSKLGRKDNVTEQPIFQELYTPEKQKLQGLSLEIAECYGKPHIGAYYRNYSINSHTAEDGAMCICGKPATNVHHHPPKSRGHYLSMIVGTDRIKLRPALIALCGSGTQGCHGEVHQKKIRITWEWNDKESAEAWWKGELLKEFEPHSPELFNYGRWKMVNTRNGKEI